MFKSSESCLILEPKVDKRVPPPRVPRYKLKNLFLRLTEWTTPHGCETMWWNIIPANDGKGVDKHGNIVVWQRHKDGSRPSVVFSSHLDTVCKGDVPQRIDQATTPDGNIFVADKATTLGADCKIGAALMIQMLWAKVPGLYIFHAGEEVGMIGSRALAADLAKVGDSLLNPFTQCIAFDRMGYDEVITTQRGEKCCSNEYATALCKALNENTRLKYWPSPNGSCTDSYQYRKTIPECINLSVGYHNQHTGREWQNIEFAEILLSQLLLIDWSALPIKRDPKVTKLKEYTTYNAPTTTGGAATPKPAVTHSQYPALKTLTKAEKKREKRRLNQLKKNEAALFSGSTRLNEAFIGTTDPTQVCRRCGEYTSQKSKCIRCLLYAAIAAARHCESWQVVTEFRTSSMSEILDVIYMEERHVWEMFFHHHEEAHID